MKNKSIFSTIAILIITLSSTAQETGTFTDSRDGKIYKTVKLGDQEWFIGNLDVNQFRNGEPIQQVKSGDEWEKCRDSCISCWCYFENDSSNGIKYGKLYNYWAVIDSNGLCPTGWHVPNDNEFIELTKYLGGSKKAAKMVKSKKSDFGDIAGGYRWFCFEYAAFSKLKKGYWWTVGLPESMHRSLEAELLIYDKMEKWKTNQQYVKIEVWYRPMKVREMVIMLNYAGYGMSVRCVKDE